MTHKTMQEQEREAYVTGHTHMAEILAKAIDGDADALRDEIESLREEVDDLKAQLGCAADDWQASEAARKELQRQLDELGGAK